MAVPTKNRAMYEATIVRNVRPSDGMARITVVAATSALPRFEQPTQWLKLFVRHPDTGEPVGRAYTVRRQRDSELDLDVVLHGNGPIARWAVEATPGDKVTIGSPRGWFAHPERAEHYLLGGDDSAAPAIATILETLPAGHPPVRAYLEVDSAEHEIALPADGDVEVIWLHRKGAVPKGVLLAEAVCELSRPRGEGVCWFAGEAGAMQRIRRHLTGEWGLSSGEFHIKGYWTLDQADHRD